MAKILKKALSISLALCIIATMFTGMFALTSSAAGTEPDMIRFSTSAEYSRLQYTKGWSTIKAGNYRFEMDCIIYEGEPIIRVGSDQLGELESWQSEYRARYLADKNRYVINFTVAEDYEGNLGLMVGNNGQANPAMFDCANPALYLLDEAGKPTGDSLINTFASDYYSTSRAGNKWNRRAPDAIEFTAIPEDHFAVEEVEDIYLPGATDSKAFYVNDTEGYTRIEYQPVYTLKPNTEYTFVTKAMYDGLTSDQFLAGAMIKVYYADPEGKFNSFKIARNEIDIEYDGENYIMKAKFTMPANIAESNNIKLVFADLEGNTNYKFWMADMALYEYDELLSDFFVEIKEENMYYTNTETKNAYRVPETRKKYFSLTEKTDIFPEAEEEEDLGYVPESENGNMLAFDFTKENNVKGEFNSNLENNLVPGKSYTFKMRFVSNMGYSAEELGKIIELYARYYNEEEGKTKGLYFKGPYKTEAFAKEAKVTEKYDAEKCIYTLKFTAPSVIHTEEYNWSLRLGDWEGGGAVRGGQAFFADFSLVEDATGKDLLGHLKIDSDHIMASHESGQQGLKLRVYPLNKYVKIQEKGDTFGAYDEVGQEVVPYIPESSNGNMLALDCTQENNVKVQYNSNLNCNLVPGKRYTLKMRFVSTMGYAKEDLDKIIEFHARYYNEEEGAIKSLYFKGPYKTEAFAEEVNFKEAYDADKCLYTASFTVPTAVITDERNFAMYLGDWEGGGAVKGGQAFFADFSCIEEGTGKDILGHLPFDDEHIMSNNDSAFYGLKWRCYPYNKYIKVQDKGDTFGWYDQLKPIYKPESYGDNMLAFDFTQENNVKGEFNANLGNSLVPGKSYTFKMRFVSTMGYSAEELGKIIELYARYYNEEEGKTKSLYFKGPYKTEAFAEEAKVTEKYDAENCIYTLKFTAPSVIHTEEYNWALRLGDWEGGGAVKGGQAFFADFSLVEDDTGRDLLGHIKIDEDHIMASHESGQQGLKLRVYPLNKYVKILPKGNTFGEIVEEEGGVKADKAIVLDKVDGNVAQFVTLKPDTKYAFTFKYKSESELKAIPYIEAFSDTASLGQIACSYSKANFDGIYNYYCEFTTPANLKSELNVRIGVYGVKTEVVYAAAFNLYEAGDEAATNLLNDGDFRTTMSINKYDGNPSTSWTLDGTGTVTVDNVFFNIPNPQVFMFAGSKNGGTITKEETLVAGTKYIASLNLKWGSEGYEGDTGVILSYHNGSDWQALTATETKAADEFKNTYAFELPADARSGKANFQITVKVGSAYVTGYVSNLVITTEADTATNLVVNGDFSMGEEGWKINGLGYKNTASMPAGYFDVDCKVEKGMFFYRNSGTWDYFQHEYVTLKSNTYYLLVLPQVHPLDDPENRMMSHAMQASGKDADGSYTIWVKGLTDTGVTKWENNVQYKHILTPDGLNATKNATVYDIIQTAGSYGYFGDCAIYESNEKGEILSNNILLNGDLRLGTACWKMSKTTGFTWRYGKQPKDFFKNFSAHADKMVTSLGTAKNAEFGQTMTLKAETKYYFSGHYVNMNGAGVTPKAYYKNANGKWEAMEVSFFIDTDRYYFEAEIVLPAEANAVGSGEVKLVIDNGNKGKGYLSDLTLAEDGSFANLFSDTNFANGLKNWTTSKNYVISNYNQEMFKFHFDDEAFDDGNWAGETTESSFTTGAIQGYVFDENGNGYKGIKMVLNGKKSDKTDKDGLYYFGDLKPGKYDLSLTSLDGTLMFIAEVEVAAGFCYEMSPITFTAVQPEVEVEQEPEIEIEVEDTNYGIVRGYLYDVDASLLKGVKVYLGNVGETVTDENGMFQFDNVRPGKYDIYVKDTDGNISILKNVEVEAGKGAVYKVQIPFAETSTNWLVIVLICAGAAVLVAVAIKVALVIKKKNANK